MQVTYSAAPNNCTAVEMLVKFTSNLILIIKVEIDVGLSDNSNEAATSAFAFMLSSIFSQFKDIVQVMPTKCLQAMNLS